MNMTTRALPTMVAALLLATSLGAQGRPDFSGRWTLDRPATVMFGGGRGDENRVASGGGGGGGGGAGLEAPAEVEIIQQDDSTMKVQLGDDGPYTVYRLDGRRTQNSVLVGQGRISDASYVSRWEGQRLVTTIVRTVGARQVRTREIRGLADDGSMLLELRTEAGGPSQGRRTLYRKQ